MLENAAVPAVADRVNATADQVEPDRLRDVDELGFELVRFVRLLGKAKSRFAGHKSGVESAAYALLVHLVGDGPQRLTALADAVHSDASTVSRQIGSLVRHGLVERRADPQDGRACLLAATEDGEQLFRQLRCQRTAVVAEILAEWSRADIRLLVNLLDRLNSSMETFEPVPAGETGGRFGTEGRN